ASAAELRPVFAEQAEVLADAGADGLVIETLTDLDEAVAALAAARPTGLPVVVSLVFGVGRGATPERAAEVLTAAGADVIGANCDAAPSLVPVCRRLRAATDRPVWVKASAGLPQVVAGRVVYPTTPQEFAAHGPALRGAGATFLGGC